MHLPFANNKLRKYLNKIHFSHSIFLHFFRFFIFLTVHNSFHEVSDTCALNVQWRGFCAGKDIEKKKINVKMILLVFERIGFVLTSKRESLKMYELRDEIEFESRMLFDLHIIH